MGKHGKKKSLDYCVIYRQINANAVGMNAVAVKKKCVLQHEIK